MKLQVEGAGGRSVSERPAIQHWLGQEGPRGSHVTRGPLSVLPLWLKRLTPVIYILQTDTPTCDSVPVSTEVVTLRRDPSLSSRNC